MTKPKVTISENMKHEFILIDPNVATGDGADNVITTTGSLKEALKQKYGY